MSQGDELENVDELRGEMRAEVEEVSSIPPIPVIAPAVGAGVKRGIFLGAAVGALLGVLVALALPALGIDWVKLAWRLIIGIGVGLAAGSIVGTIGGVEMKEEPRPRSD